MKQDFQAGVDSIYNALVAAGATPGSKDPADIVGAINSGMGKNFAVMNGNPTEHDHRYMVYHTVYAGDILILAEHRTDNGNTGYVFSANRGGVSGPTATWDYIQYVESAAWVTSFTQLSIVKVTRTGTIACAGGVAVKVS